jgi:hypothetical protein
VGNRALPGNPPFTFRPRMHSRDSREIRIRDMLLIVAILLLLFWGTGFAFHVAGGLIHLLLVIALIVFILHFARGGKGV